MAKIWPDIEMDKYRYEVDNINIDNNNKNNGCYISVKLKWVVDEARQSGGHVHNRVIISAIIIVLLVPSCRSQRDIGFVGSYSIRSHFTILILSCSCSRADPVAAPSAHAQRTRVKCAIAPGLRMQPP